MSEDEIKGHSDVGLATFIKGSLVETLIISGRHKGIWIKARILRIAKNKLDLAVEFPKKWMVANTALAVPRKLIRVLTDTKSYTIPVEFTLNATVLYISCNSHMTIRDLKVAINKERNFLWHEMYFICNGEWLINSDAIPNDRIFCVIHRGGRLTRRLIDLVSTWHKPRPPSYSSASLSRETDSSIGWDEQSFDTYDRQLRTNSHPSRGKRNSCDPLQLPIERRSSQSTFRKGIVRDLITPLADSNLRLWAHGAIDLNFEADMESKEDFVDFAGPETLI